MSLPTVAEPVGFGKALTRALFRYIDAFFFALPAYYTMNPPLQQRIGDKSAGTIVIDVISPMIKQRRKAWRFLAAAGLYVMVIASFALFSAILSLG